MEDAPGLQLVHVGKPGGVTAAINLNGAQLWRLIDRDGTDLLWGGDPAVWSGRAPILFPIVGSLTGGVFRYQGASYALHRHGFARHSRFSVVEHNDQTVLLRLQADEVSRRVYPFAFQLDLRFSCSDAALELSASVRNLGEDIMPFSFGFHPALRWPLEPGAPRSDHAITFAAPEPAPISRLDAQGLILQDRAQTPVSGRRLALRDELFAADAVIFTELASRSVDYGAQDGDGAGGRHMRVDFANLPYLGVWTKPGAGYICIEPWQGLADPEGFTGDIFAKPGIVTLPAGAAWDASMTLSPHRRGAVS